MPRVRSLLFAALFYALFVAMSVAGLPAFLGGRPAVLRLARAWARTNLWLLRVVCGTRVDVRGLDALPAGACLVAAKHQSYLEVLALIATVPDFTFVLKRELMRIPLFGWYLAACGQIAIDRARGGSALAQVVRQAGEVLAAGRPIIIFPEGTRRPPGAEPAYKLGAAVVYAQMGVPCLPLAVNTGLFWPRGTWLRRPGTAVLAFLPSIAPGLGKSAFQRLLQDRLEAATADLVEEAFLADPALRADHRASADAAEHPRAIRTGKPRGPG